MTDFARGADLLVREAQYTDEEYPEHRGWGHSTSTDAVQDAIDGGVRRLALFHHDPDHDDQFLETELARLQASRQGSGLEIQLAREGQTIELA
jgi:ribonuclease BN (tRNA processing enzyme)